MLALLDRSPDALCEGDLLPLGWHWLYAHSLVKRSEWGRDGHARLGTFLPAIPNSRRMWAGGSMRFLQPLLIGNQVEHRSKILSIEEKEGRSGKFLLVRVGHQISSPRGLAVDEVQNLVYLPVDAPSSSSVPSVPSVPSVWKEVLTTDPVLLFYFSALTMNGHRIHYDHPYTTQTEGYPGLLVHAPLTALLLLDAAQRHNAKPVTEFKYRATSPLYCGDTMTLAGNDNGTEVWCLRPDGAVAMQAQLAR
jgi:3-methylfumaryl-CoA hydratase